MNSADTIFAKLLASRQSLASITINQLEDIIKRFPYFAFAHLLLSKKLRQGNNSGYTAQMQRTALYFTNLQWLKYHLLDAQNTSLPVVDEQKNEITLIPGVDNVLEKNTDGHSHTLPIDAKVEKATPVEDSNIITLPAEEILSNISLNLGDVKDEPETLPLDDDEDLPIDEEKAEISSAKIANLLEHQAQDFNAPIKEDTKLSIETEPYYTIDYFASQGIKVEQQSQDMLTKKVHKFTDWLRQMKRINASPTDLGSDPEMESFVQNIADTSNQAKEIVTEAMAEVLVKQGKAEKATELYEKLSLFNPAKSAYFAAKIQQLKEI